MQFANPQEARDFLAAHPDVRLIEMGENAGFCRGNNAAIRQGDAEYVLLVNTDTRLFDDTVDSMLDTMRSDRTAAVVGPRLQFADGNSNTNMTTVGVQYRY